MRPKILLVEDNENNKTLALRFLEDDFNVLVAQNGKEGVEIAKREIPDLILMDLSLPIMTGWEAIKILKQYEETRSIPIIALTAHALNKDREEAFSAGCDDLETKPIDFDALIQKIHTWLKKVAA